MIVSDSEKTESSRHSARSPGSEAAQVIDAPPSPPPYTPSASGSNVHPQGQGRPSSSGGVRVPSGSMPNPNASPAPRANLPPRCNHLVERKSNTGINGTWHVDTTLQIPEGLLPPITEVDGQWNQDIQNARKEREKEKRRRESIWRSTPTTPLPPPPVEVRPNLMLATSNAPIRGQVHVVSSDGSIRPAIIVSQCSNASINLTVHAAPDQPLRVFANSSNASVNVRIPPSFEGAVIMSTTYGSVKISDPIKEKLTTFSSTSNTTRCFIGDWQAHGFGMPHPDDDPPLPDFQSTPPDPFAKWTGPLVHLSSSNASISLSLNDESTWSSGPTGFWGFVSGLFGGDDGSSSSQPPQPSQQSRPPQPPRPSAPNDGQSQDKKLPPPPPSNSPPQDKKLPLPPDDLIALD